MGSNKKSAPRRKRGAGKPAAPAKAARKPARKPVEYTHTVAVVTAGDPKPQHVVLPPVKVEPFGGMGLDTTRPRDIDPPMDGLARDRAVTRRLLVILAYLALVVAILLWARPASAGVLAVIPMQEGGGLRLTDTPCPDREGYSIAYLVQPGGKMVSACWAYDPEEGSALVQYGNGDLYLYTLTDDMATDYMRAKIGEKRL